MDPSEKGCAPLPKAKVGLRGVALCRDIQAGNEVSTEREYRCDRADLFRCSDTQPKC